MAGLDAPHRGTRTTLLGLGLAAMALLPMGFALLDPDDAAFPSGRPAAFLAGATFFFCGVWLLGVGLGRAWRAPIALLVTGFAGVPVAITLADPALARGARTLPWLPLVQSLYLGTIAAYQWYWVLRGRVATTQGARGLAASVLGLAAAAAFIAPLAPLGAAVGLALPVLSVVALVLGLAGHERRRRSLGGLALTLAALPLVVAPARAIVRLAAPVPLPRMRMPLVLEVADPSWRAAIDATLALAALLVVAVATLRRRLPDLEQDERSLLLPDGAHLATAGLLCSGLALASLMDLRPELAPWRAQEIGAPLPAEIARAVLRIGSRDPSWRERALRDLDALDADLAPAVDRLFALLEHADAGVRDAAATALRLHGRIGPGEPRRRVDALVAHLRSPDPGIRRLALTVLPAARPDDAALLTMVRDRALEESAWIRDEALGSIAASGAGGRSLLEALALEGDTGSCGLVLRILEPRLEARERVELHRRLLASPARERRWLAIEGLAALATEEPGIVDDLAAVVATDPDGAVRERALLALGEHGPETLRELDPALLASFLDSELWSVRQAARGALDQQGAPREIVLPGLIDALESADTYVREEAMAHLKRVGAPPEAAERVARLLREDTRQNLRVAAAELLASMGADAAPAAAALAEVAVGHDPWAAARALETLASMGPAARAALPILETRRGVAGGAYARTIAAITAAEPAPSSLATGR